MHESGFVEVEGARLYYEAEGEGAPLLLIHGGLGSLRMWDDQAAAFSDSYRVIRFDTRGFGQTESEDAEFSNRADAIAVLDHLGAGPSHLVGQSRGGIIGLDLVIEHPSRFRSFVSVASGVGGFMPDLPEGVEGPPWDDMEARWAARDWDALAELETQVWVDGWGQSPERVDPAVRARVKQWILDNYFAAKPEGKPQPLDPPAAERLGEVSLPLLVLVGTADEPGTVVAGRHLAATVNGARLVELDVAHMIQLEQPQRFNELLREFLAAVDAT